MIAEQLRARLKEIPAGLVNVAEKALTLRVGNLAHPSYQTSIWSVGLFLNALVPTSLLFPLLDKLETDLPARR